MDINEKNAIIYLLDVLSVNMLDNEKVEKYDGETYMLLNPTDWYLLKKVNWKVNVMLLKICLMRIFPIKKVVELICLSKEDILNAKLSISGFFF